MNTIYRSVILGVLSISLATSAGAQNKAANDSTLTRQILLEKEFNPTLQDASKINTLPAVHQPVVKPANLQYETSRPSIEFNQYKITNTGSGDIKTNIDYSKKRGYLDLGAGIPGNFYGAFGYKFLSTPSDELDVFARYTGFDGNVDFAESGHGLKDAKAKYSNILARAKYQHNFEFLSWRLNVGYENTGFNYYGNPFSLLGSGLPFDSKKKQSVGNFDVETGVKSTDNNMFIYDASVKLNFFSTKYGISTEDDGVSGNIIEGKLNVAAPFGSDKLIGINMNIINQSFGDVDFLEEHGWRKDDFFHSLTKLSFNPYINLDGSNYLLKLGLKTDYAIDKENKFLIAPDIRFDWTFADKTKLYASVTGGINENTYLQILQENRYTDPTIKTNYSRTTYDVSLGVKSGIINGFEFDIFGGYKETKDEHLYIYGHTESWRNVSFANYYDLSTGHFGGQIKTSLIPYTDLSAKVIGYFYDVDDELAHLDHLGNPIKAEAWNLPKMTLDIKADITPIDKLTLSASYYLATGRKGFYPTSSIAYSSQSLKNINELNVRGNYQILDWISINAGLNNIFNQKYESLPGYTHQGFGFMGGVSLKF